eukprot:4245706-Pleurochrysis_carterae.AAC.1
MAAAQRAERHEPFDLTKRVRPKICDPSFSRSGKASIKRYRHRLPRGPIGRSGPPNVNLAQLHLACTYLCIFDGIYPERPSGNRAGSKTILSCNTNNQGRGSERRSGSLARLKCGSGSGALRH